MVTFKVDPTDEEDQPSVEDVLNDLKDAIEEGKFEIPLGDGTKLKPDENFFITHYDEVTPENGKYQIKRDIVFRYFSCKSSDWYNDIFFLFSIRRWLLIVLVLWRFIDCWCRLM